MSEIPSKICKRCGEEKYHFDFGRVKKSRDGLNSTCKKCISIEYAERQKRDFPPRAKDYPYL